MLIDNDGVVIGAVVCSRFTRTLKWRNRLHLGAFCVFLEAKSQVLIIPNYAPLLRELPAARKYKIDGYMIHKTGIRLRSSL